MNRFAIFVVLIPWCLLATRNHVAADELVEKKQIAEALKLTTEAAKMYRVSVDVEEVPTIRCKLQPNPVLKWSNPVAGNIYGNVFLWTHDNQPVAVGSFYKWFSPWTHGTHEFHSLSTRPLNAVFKTTSIWTPTNAGITWKSLEDSSTPAKSTSRRLVQMRRITKQFSVIKTARNELARNMRLLSQPVYRYECSQSGIADGALFVFVQGTDPEIWLMIEAVSSQMSETATPQELSADKEQLRWRYAVARMNTTRFELRRNDKTVEDFPTIKWKAVSVETAPYFKINTDKLP